MTKDDLKRLLYTLISKNLHTTYKTKDFISITINYEGEQPSYDFRIKPQDKYSIQISYPFKPRTTWYIYFNTNKELNEVLNRLIDPIYNDYEELTNGK